MGDVVLEDETWVVANYVVVAASSLIFQALMTLPGNGTNKQCRLDLENELPLKCQSSVTQIIIRDGTLYFIATLVLAAIDAVLLLTSLKSPGDTNSLSEVVGPFFNVFSNLLISRLMLNLHTFNTSGNIMMNRGVASIQSSSLHFAPIAFGAPLDVTDGAVEEMEMERQ
ncbi:hypothetical protein J3R30DRAFT_3406221 [Lentinula aciculospora]|uniref:Uncharacterized protein n=1 Tax=Lentinula aciculospora TaxID=153920 RepID=A0A9W9A871_9AGAR|nr:hypothetical protein J3R30DRAFT_3406221 [Lentinula aciculospora]